MQLRQKMTEFTHLWLFFLMVLGIIVLPGMDMAFVLASALAGGRRRGAFAVAGIVAGGVCHTLSGVLGVGLLFKLVPGLTDTMLIVAALYIAGIGVSLLRSQSGSEPGIHEGASSLLQVRRTAWSTFRQALMTCLLNPKAYLFTLAVFPQFLRVEYGAVWVQALALGGIIAMTQIAVYGGLALAAGSTQGWLAGRPAAGLVIARMAGGMLLLGALVTAVGVVRAF